MQSKPVLWGTWSTTYSEIGHLAIKGDIFGLSRVHLRGIQLYFVKINNDCYSTNVRLTDSHKVTNVIFLVEAK